VRWSSADLRAVGGIVVGALLMVSQRSHLAGQHQRMTATHDVYLLPPAEQTLVLSLGYRAAAADLIFGHVLVSAGIHLAEKRLFEYAGLYFDAINTLDPTFRDPYRYADALLTLQAVAPPEEMYRQARRILLRGTEEFPYDQALWSAAGQFLAYLAPPQLKDKREAEAWRQEGARLLARACELIGSNENIPYQCVTAAALYGEAGKSEASRAFLQKLLVVSDDPELQRTARAQLAAMGVHAQDLRVEQLRRQDLPFVSRAAFAVLGPRFDAAACSGKPQKGSDDACATSLRDRLTQLEMAE
jgi:hypothetical protein